NVYQSSSQLAAGSGVNGVSGWKVVAAGDFNGDGKPDIVWQNSTTWDVTVWYMTGAGGNVYQGNWNYLAQGSVVAGWRIAAIGDLNGDGKRDLVWQNTSDWRVSVWYMG